MPYYCNFNGTGYLTAPTLGNLLTANKIRVVIKRLKVVGDGFIISQSGAGSSREFGVLYSGGSLNYIYGSSTERTILTTAETSSNFGSGGYFDLTFDNTASTVVLRNDVGGTIKSVSLVKGGSRIDGMLFRLGARCGNDTTDTSGGFIAANGTWIGDVAIYINDVLVRNYITPSTGTTIPDSVGGNDLTQRGTWPANDLEWVFYSNITSTLPSKLAYSTSESVSLNLNNYFSGATSYAIQSGVLPSGLSLTSSTISGTLSTSVSSESVTIRASDSGGGTLDKTVQFLVGTGYQLTVTGSGGGSKFVVAATPAATSNTGRPLQVEWEIEFEARRTATDWPVASKSGVAAEELLFLRTGSDFELRSTGNSNWQVTTGLTLTNFNTFRIRTTFDGTTRTQQLFLNGSTTPFATRTPTTANFSGFGALFTLANDATRSGEFRYLKWTDFVTPANNRVWDARVSDGLQTVLNETVTGATASLTNLTYSWVFYPSGGTSFTGTIGKTTLTPTTQALSLALGSVLSPNKQTLSPSVKQLSINTGLVLSPNKQTISVGNKQLGVVAGVSLGVGKQALILNTKPEFVQAGAVVTNGKQAYPLATKQLSVVVGANVPFTATINKSSYSLSGKQLAVHAGWSNSVSKDSLVVQGKQEIVNAGALFNINEQHLTLSKKGLSLVTGTSISFVGELNKANLNAVGKPLSVVTGTSIPFSGTIQKTSLTLSGKALTRTNGHILEIQKQSLNLVNKQLSIGETIYPIIPVERLFTIKDGDRVYLMKQTTTIYIMKNN